MLQNTERQRPFACRSDSGRHDSMLVSSQSSRRDLTRSTKYALFSTYNRTKFIASAVYSYPASIKYIDLRQAITVTTRNGSGVFGLRDGHVTRRPSVRAKFGQARTSKPDSSWVEPISTRLAFELNLKLYMIPK